MPVLLDTSILLRVRHKPAPEYPLVRGALRRLVRTDELAYSPQNVVEFWSVSTRPSTSRGGLGLSLVETQRRLRLIERVTTLLPDTDEIHEEWKRVVVQHGVSGVQVHDARLAAVMKVHGVTHILTLNPTDFARYPGITALHPRDV